MSGVTKKRLSAVSDRIENDFGFRYCTSCNLSRAALGGQWIVYDNGLRRRWRCAGCIKTGIERRKKSLEAKNA